MSASSFSRFRPAFLRKKDEITTAVDMTLAAEDKTTTIVDVDGIAHNQEPAGDDLEKDIVPTEDAQRGVQEVEAVTLTWTKPYLIAVFLK